MIHENETRNEKEPRNIGVQSMNYTASEVNRNDVIIHNRTLRTVVGVYKNSDNSQIILELDDYDNRCLLLESNEYVEVYSRGDNSELRAVPTLHNETT